MTRAPLAAIAALSFGLACTETGRSVVLVEVNADTGVVGVSQVLVHITRGGQSIRHAEGNAPLPVKLGVYLPKDVSGPVNIEVCAFAAEVNGTRESVQARNISDPVTVTPGGTIGPIIVVLVPGQPFASCGGTGGMGGTGGSTGGSAGGTSGTGGGSSGSGGTGGSVGGTSGTGGSAAGTGGGAGTGGRGGTTGTGGVAGTGGRGGTGGGAGNGGRGGAAGAGGAGGGGGGTSGTGGAAGWRGAVVMPPVVGQDQRAPSVAVDALGNAVVIYDQGGQVWANHYGRTGGWGTPGAVDARSSLQGTPQIAVDRNGTYLAVWGLQTGSSDQGIWYSTSTNGVQWSPQPARLSDKIAVFPMVAMNADGAVIVAWSEQVQGALYQPVGAARPAPGMPWQVQVLRTGDYGDRDPVVAIAGNGNGFVGWTQHDGLGNFNDSVWMAQFTVEGGVGSWKASATIEDYLGYNAYGPSIAANTGGEAIVTYTQITTSNPRSVQVWARRFNGTAWQPSLTVFDAPSIDSNVPHSVTLDDAGNATVAFPVETSTGFQVQTSRTARTATMWPSVPTAMETDDVAKANDPNSNIAHVTMPIVRSDPAGNVTLVWRKRTAASGLRFDLVSRRYTAGNWAPAVTAPATSLEDNLTNSVFFPALAVGTGGTAVTTWYFANSLDVWAAVFP